MATLCEVDGKEVTITDSLATTPSIDTRQMRAFGLRAAPNVTVTLFVSRYKDTGFKAVKLLGATGANHTIALVDEYQPVDTDLFFGHFVKLVAASGTAVVEYMGKA